MGRDSFDPVVNAGDARADLVDVRAELERRRRRLGAILLDVRLEANQVPFEGREARPYIALRGFASGRSAVDFFRQGCKQCVEAAVILVKTAHHGVVHDLRCIGRSRRRSDTTWPQLVMLATR